MLNKSLLTYIDKMEEELENMALKIHLNPETAFEEHFAVKTLTRFLQQNGFKIEEQIAGLETAFLAEYKGKKPGPVIGLLAEYDALPVLGHGCGHNLIGTASVGAAVALKNFYGDNLKGTIKVIGTPAEEEGGGKIIMAKEGIFEGVDIAMMCHPKNDFMVLRGGLSCVDITFKFYGKESHASSAPEEGISALDAAINSFVSINSLREYQTDDVRIHGIISKGGEAPNIVPQYAETKFLVRAKNEKGLKKVKDKLIHSVNSTSKAVGATVEVLEGLTYAERKPNNLLAKTFKKNMERLGEKVTIPPKQGGLGSSDIGNVSKIIPTIHPYFKIGENANHTMGFVEDSKSEMGIKGMVLATKSLAMTACDVIESEVLFKNIQQEFKGENINGKI